MNYNKQTTCKISKKNLLMALKLSETTDENELLPTVVTTDLYDVMVGHGVDAGIANAFKKVTYPGVRHNKNKLTDLQEALGCLKRVIEIEETREHYGL